MQLEEMNRIWRLLGKLRPRDSGKLQDRELLAAWLLVLEPYPYEEVRQSVADYFRHRNYWPDVTDIAKGCPSYTPPSTSGQEKWGQPALGRIREQEAWLDWFLGEEASEPPEQLEWTEARNKFQGGRSPTEFVPSRREEAKRPSRCEQPGWTGARDNHTRQAQPAMVVPSRKEAGRREQARRDKEEASEPS